MRELGAVDADEDTEAMVFAKISEYARACRFRDCDHDRSAGCAVQAAIAAGEIEATVLQNFHKLQQERTLLQSKATNNATRHYEQNQKRQRKRDAAVRREKLSRRLR
jgi:ribosome biogenesis GTPase